MWGKTAYEHGLDMDANYTANKHLAPYFTLEKKNNYKLSHTFWEFYLWKDPFWYVT